MEKAQNAQVSNNVFKKASLSDMKNIGLLGED